LILPSILPVIGILVTDLGIAATYLGWSGIGWISAPLHVGVLTLELFQIANVLFLLAIGIVMFFRFTRVSRDQARGAAELEAAQRVQALLLRSSQERVPGLTIETVYSPAQEVGGDFFHTAYEGGVMRVVIGDVSGKGLGAAMLVSAVVGALDTLHDSCPSRVLRVLNALLLTRQQGGFATCVCARISQDGAITFANAGHLAPYCNGEELPLESGLPLGIVAVAEYPETVCKLKPGDRLTFLSDGVVEAQSATGELFGFDRTAAISTQSAEEIAAAAQAFGQDDDITVLTLTFAPIEVARA
jgi:serine phosphatase RsbU (regulator of sigma subunit)